MAVAPAVGRVPATISPNSSRRSFKGDSPTRCSNLNRAASRAIKSNPQLSSKINSTNPNPPEIRNPTKGTSTRVTEHSKDNCITPSSISTRSLVGGLSSRHFRKMENVAACPIIDPPQFRSFAKFPRSFCLFLDSVRARNEAAKSQSSDPPPSPESRASLNEHGRNYSARNAKRKPFGSPVSSRKRS